MPKQLEFNYREILRMLLRRKWLLLAIFCVGSVASAVVSYVLPNVYEARVLILVERSVLPDNSVSMPVPGIEERLRLLQTFLTSDNLLRQIITTLQLVPNPDDAVLVEERVRQLRKNIALRLEGRSRTTGTFQISYQGRDPHQIMLITNELANRFIEESQNFSTKVVRETSEFLTAEKEELEQKLRKQERQIGEFRAKHLYELPEQLESNQRSLDRLQAQLDSLNKSLQAAQEKERSLEKELAMTPAVLVGGNERQVAPSASGFPEPIDPLAVHLAQLRRSLEDLQTRYTDAHPDVQRIKREMAEIKERFDARQTQRPEGGKGEPFELPNPLHLNLRLALEKVRKEVRSLEQERNETLKKIVIYQARVDSAPKRQLELLLVTRDYDLLKARHAVLVNRKMEAEMSQKLEAWQKSERFRILEPAPLPAVPVAPNRLRFLAVGLLGSFLLGVGTIYLVETSDTSFRTARAVEEALGIAVLASIPRLVPSQVGQVPSKKPFLLRVW